MISQSQTLITGVYRTGSEFLTYLIDTHPDIMASMYKINLMRFYYGRYGESNNIDISTLIDDLSYRLNFLQIYLYFGTFLYVLVKLNRCLKKFYRHIATTISTSPLLFEK